MNAPIGSFRWQAGLLGMTTLGAVLGLAALAAKALGYTPPWARD